MIKVVLGNDRGSVMNIALLILIMLTMIVMFMSRTSTTNVQIATNERLATTAFFGADGGSYAGPKVVGWMMDNGRAPTYGPGTGDFPNIDFVMGAGVVGDTCLYDKVMGFALAAACPKALSDPAFRMTFEDLNNDGISDVHDEAVSFKLASREVKVALQRTATETNDAGSTSFADGDSGTNSGGASSISIYYTIEAIGEAPKNTMASVDLQYRKIPDTGGL